MGKKLAVSNNLAPRYGAELISTTTEDPVAVLRLMRHLGMSTATEFTFHDGLTLTLDGTSFMVLELSEEEEARIKAIAEELSKRSLSKVFLVEPFDTLVSSAILSSEEIEARATQRFVL